MKIIKIKIHVAKNVGNVWIRQKKHTGSISYHFMLPHGPKSIKKMLSKFFFLGI